MADHDARQEGFGEVAGRVNGLARAANPPRGMAVRMRVMSPSTRTRSTLATIGVLLAIGMAHALDVRAALADHPVDEVAVADLLLGPTIALIVLMALAQAAVVAVPLAVRRARAAVREGQAAAAEERAGGEGDARGGAVATGSAALAERVRAGILAAGAIGGTMLVALDAAPLWVAEALVASLLLSEVAAGVVRLTGRPRT